MTVADIVAYRVRRHGSLRAAARAMRIDAGYLSRLGAGTKKDPSAATLKKLGAVRVVEYRIQPTLKEQP